MMDYRFLLAAVAIMLIIIARDLLKKHYNFDMDSFDVKTSSQKAILWLKDYFTNFFKDSGSSKKHYEPGTDFILIYPKKKEPKFLPVVYKKYELAVIRRLLTPKEREELDKRNEMLAKMLLRLNSPYKIVSKPFRHFILRVLIVVVRTLARIKDSRIDQAIQEAKLLSAARLVKEKEDLAIREREEHARLMAAVAGLIRYRALSVAGNIFMQMYKLKDVSGKYVRQICSSHIDQVQDVMDENLSKDDFSPVTNPYSGVENSINNVYSGLVNAMAQVRDTKS